MSEIINVYCDESCHLEHDQSNVMVLGAVWCLKKKVSHHACRLREIKVKHGLNPKMEIKWTKISPAKEQFYLDVLDYFFDNSCLHFRALIVPDKSLISHELFNQTHDEWYYKLYFTMLKTIIDPEFKYNIYLDHKDTQGAIKVAKLHTILANDRYDFSKDIIEKIQLVRSHEIELLQLSDMLIGAITYANRGLQGNKAKEAIVSRMRSRSCLSLLKSTLPKESKLNLFRWSATLVREE